MRTLFFKGDISDENVSNLIMSIEDLEEKDINIYFTSGGGVSTSADILVDYINSKLEELNINIIIYWQCDSAAFDLVSRLNCKKTVLDSAFSCIHIYAMDVNTRENQKQNKFLLKALDETNKLLLERYKSFLTTKEFKAIKNKEDVYICNERLKMILS